MYIFYRVVPDSFTIFLCFVAGLAFSSCDEQPDPKKKYAARGRKVEIVFENGKYTLLRNGKPYFIKGAGGYEHFDKIREHGGNSIRVWHTEDAQRILDEAHKNGLTVTLGLWLAPENEGFNYYDKELVAQQYQQMREAVMRYKDHPALLMWGLGNELNLDASNTKVWDAVNEIAEMIHELDPDHPTATMLVGARTKLINLITTKCPAIDVIAVNSFGSMENIPGKISKSEWPGPYIISEFGARGYWETYTTWWYAPLEQTSSAKASFIRNRYKKVISADTDRCLGGYVFYWGYKFEGTPTWFSLFSRTGEKTEMVNAMEELWAGDSSANKPPYVAYLKLNDAYGHENIYLKTQSEYEAKVFTFDPDGDSLTLKWEVLPEAFDENGKENRTTKVEPLPVAMNKISDSKIRLRTPAEEGPYRLFVYIYDQQGHVATANAPFFVNSAGAYTKIE